VLFERLSVLVQLLLLICLFFVLFLFVCFFCFVFFVGCIDGADRICSVDFVNGGIRLVHSNGYSARMFENLVFMLTN
jgi:hypothetical protein